MKKKMKEACLFLLLFVSIGLTGQSDILTEFQQKWKNASEYTIEMAELMPAKSYKFQPAEDMRTYEEQLLHMMGNMVWLSSSYLGGGKFEKDLKRTDYVKSEIVALLKESTEFAMNAVKNLKADDLEEEVDFFAGPMTKRQIMMLLNDHLTHHRGQIIVYLRLNGIAAPKYRGW